jgi:hypothetical protein
MLGGLLGTLPFGMPAMSAVCHVPAAILCQGCVTNLSIRIIANGACRISFTPAAANDGAAKFVDIEIEAEPHRATARSPRLAHSWTADRSPPLHRASPCFVFNARRFCE